MKANGLFIGAMSVLMTVLIPIGYAVQTSLKDTPVVHYATFGLGKLLCMIGALPFLLVNSATVQFINLNLYELPLVGGVFMMCTVSFVLWYVFFIIALGSNGGKISRRNVRFV